MIWLIYTIEHHKEQKMQKIKSFVEILQERTTFKAAIVVLAVVVALMISVLIFHRVVINDVFDAVVQTTQDVADKTTGFTDYAIETAKNFCMLIYNDENVISLRSKSSLTNHEWIVCLRQLNNLVTSGNFIDSIYVYNGSMDYIYSTSRESNTPTDFFDAEAAMLFNNRGDYHSLEPILRNGSNISTVTSVKQIYSFLVYDRDINGNPKNNAVLVNIKPSWFNDLFFLETPRHPSYFVDSELNIVASWDIQGELGLDEELSAMLRERFEDRSPSGYVCDRKLNESTPICFYARTDVNDWYYLQISTYGRSFPYLVRLENIINLILTLSVAILLPLIILIVIPYIRIRASISKIDSTDIGITTGDPTDKLNRLIELSLDSQRIKESINLMMKDEVIRSFLYGSAQKGMSFSRMISEYGISLEPERPVTVMLVSNGTRVKEYLEEIKQYWQYADGVLMSGDHSVILVQPDENATIQTVMNAMHIRFGAYRRFVVSPPIADWYRLHDTYDMMRRMSLLFSLRSDSYWIDCNSIGSSPDIPVQELRNRVRNLLSMLRSSEPASFMSTYDEYMSEITSCSYETAISYVSMLRSQCVAMLSELDPKLEVDTHESVEELLIRLGSPEAVSRYFMSKFEAISSYTLGEKQAKALKQANNVIDLINAEYRDPSLSAQTIADKMNLSYAYLSRGFRQATGQSIANYINHVRLEEARMLLLQPDIRIKSIPSMVGFENQQYFFVIFKKQYGETPGAYRDRLLGSGS